MKDQQSDLKKKENITTDYNDFTNAYSAMLDMSFDEKYQKMNKDTLGRFTHDLDYFVKFHLKYDLDPRIDYIENNSLLSPQIKTILKYEMKSMYIEHLLSYPIIINQYKKILSLNTTDSLMSFVPKSYYSFLKDFRLNDPYYLYAKSYFYVVENLLSIQNLDIASIRNTPINEWLQDTKNKIADLVGFEDGSFYDLLVIAAFNKQFSDKNEPLSDIQLQNINTYYRGGAVEEILLRKNSNIEPFDDSFGDVIVNTTPQISNETLMKEIISRYEGKIVIVDFWATWCGPCLSAIKDMTPLKAKYNKDVAFIYLTDPSSNPKIWEDKIAKIKGTHYYLTNEQWQYLMNEYAFEAIPSYLIYDKNGELNQKFTSYPGNEVIENFIKDINSKK